MARKPKAAKTTFTVIQNGADFIVADASFGPRSAALVPADRRHTYSDRKEAERQARGLSGQEIPLRMIETPDRFEAIADTLYGPAWE